MHVLRHQDAITGFQDQHRQLCVMAELLPVGVPQREALNLVQLIAGKPRLRRDELWDRATAC